MKNESNHIGKQNIQYPNMTKQLNHGHQSQSQQYLQSSTISLNQTLNADMIKAGANSNPYNIYIAKRSNKVLKDKQQFHNNSYQNLPTRSKQDRVVPIIADSQNNNFPNLRQSSTESFKMTKSKLKDIKYGNFKKNKKLQQIQKQDVIPEKNSNTGGATSDQNNQFTIQKNYGYKDSYKGQSQKTKVEQLNIIGIGHSGQSSIQKISIDPAKNEKQTTNNNISNMSTNPSSSQIQVRKLGEPEIIKQNNDYNQANSQKQLIVLKQKLVGNSDKTITIKKFGYDSSQGLLPQYQINGTQHGNTNKKPTTNQLDAIKSIYSVNQMSTLPTTNKDYNQEHAQNSYSYFQGKLRQKNPFNGASRNSQAAFLSANLGQNASTGNINQIKLGKGLVQNSSMNVYCQNNVNHSVGNLNIHLQNSRQQNMSHTKGSKQNSSHKNSKHNTKTSFGINSQNNYANEPDTDILEIRGKSSSTQPQSSAQHLNKHKLKMLDGVQQRQAITDTIQTKQNSISQLTGHNDSTDQENYQIDDLNQYFNKMQQKQEMQERISMQNRLQSQTNQKNYKIQKAIMKKSEGLFPDGGDLKKQMNSKSERKELKQRSVGQFNNDTQEISDSILKQAPFQDEIQEPVSALTAAQNTMEKPTDVSNFNQNIDPLSSGIGYFQKQGKMMKKSQMKSQQQKSRQQKLYMPQNINNSSSASRMIRVDQYRNDFKKEYDSTSMHLQSLPQIPIYQNTGENKVQLKSKIRNMHNVSDLNNQTTKSFIGPTGQRDLKNQISYDLQRNQNESQDVNMSLQDELNPDDQVDFISNQNVYDAYGGQKMNRLQENTLINHKSFDHTQTGLDLDVSINITNDKDGMSQNHHTNQTVIKHSNVDDKSLLDKNSHQNSPKFNAGVGSYSSLERMQRYESNNRSLNRDKGSRNPTEISQGPLINHAASEQQLRRIDSNALANDNRQHKGHNGIQLAPLRGVRDAFGNGPGTANTHGGVQRQNYKNTSQMNMQYKVQSQQCQSEMFNMNNHYKNLENMNEFGLKNNFNFQSNLDESFDNLAETPFQHLDALDPKEDVEHIPSKHSITINRQQRSQGTYRQHHLKMEQVLYKYHNAPLVPQSEQNQLNSAVFCSKSESIANNQQQIRDAQLQASQFSASQLSSNEHLSDQKSMGLQKNRSNLSKRETTSQDESHPFNGPKLHLYRKGQSKSSQSKLRKFKGSRMNNDRLNEINSIANGSNVQYTGQESIHNQLQGYNKMSDGKQLSEGGGMYQIHQNKKQASKTKEGHINIQEILNAHEQGINLLNADRMYNDMRSQNSHGYTSQNSNEIGMNIGGVQSKDSYEHHNLLDHMDTQSQQQLHGHAKGSFDQSNVAGVNQGTNRRQDQKSEFINLINQDGIGMETKSQQPQNISNFSTIQNSHLESSNVIKHRGNHIVKFTPDHTTNKGGSRSVLLQQQQENSPRSPYNVDSSCSQRFNASLNNHLPKVQGAVPVNQKSDILIQKIQEQQRSGNRPNTTNPTGPLGTIQTLQGMISKDSDNQISDQKSLGKAILKPINHNGISQNFHHPKVGKNSKHPQVFKNHGSISQQSSGKNLQRKMVASSKLLDKSQSGSNLNLNESYEQTRQQIEEDLQAAQENLMKNYNSSGPPSTGKPRIFPRSKQLVDPQAQDINQEQVLNATKSQRQLKNPQNTTFETTFENFKYSKEDRNSSQEIQRKQSNIIITQNNLSKQNFGSSIKGLNEFINDEISKDEKQGVQRSSSYKNRVNNLKSRQGTINDRQTTYTTDNRPDTIKDDTLNYMQTSDQKSIEAPKSSFSENVQKQKAAINKQSSNQVLRAQDEPIVKNPQILESLDQLKIQLLRDEGHKQQNQAIVETAHFKNDENDNNNNNNKEAHENIIFNQQIMSQTQDLSQKSQHFQENLDDQVNLGEKQMSSPMQIPIKAKDKLINSKARQHNNSEQVNGEYIESSRFGSNIGLQINGNDPMQSSMSQNLGQTVNQSHSIAQTPCFAETPNTTDQFIGYKIETKDHILGMANLENINIVGSQASNGQI